MNHVEKYFVCSGPDHPEQMYFDWDTAEAAAYLYIDTFNADGDVVRSMKLTERGYVESF